MLLNLRILFSVLLAQGTSLSCIRYNLYAWLCTVHCHEKSESGCVYVMIKQQAASNGCGGGQMHYDTLCEYVRRFGTNRAAMGSLFPNDGGLSGLTSEDIVEVVECGRACLFADPMVAGLCIGNALDIAGAGKWGFGCGEVVEEAEGVVGGAQGRRCITVFTITRLVSSEVGNSGSVGSGFASTQKFRPLDGMGGIMRALYIVL